MGLIRFPLWVWGSTSLPFGPPELRYEILQKYPNMVCNRKGELDQGGTPPWLDT